MLVNPVEGLTLRSGTSERCEGEQEVVVQDTLRCDCHRRSLAYWTVSGPENCWAAWAEEADLDEFARPQG
ncbi:hypothetical protein GCM10009623_26420 [Nocardioides aestuarii]